jgi:muramidase (phage lysozyme)
MAMERMGGNADAARGTLQKFAEAKADFAIGKNADFGIQMGRIGGTGNTSPLEAIKLFQAYIEKYKDTVGGIQKISAVNRALGGIIDPDTLNAMLRIKTVANLNKELAESLKNGVPDQKDVDAALALSKAFHKLGENAKTAGRHLLTDLSPSLTDVTEKMTTLIQNNPDIAEGVMAITTALTVLGGVRLSAKLMGLTSLVDVLDGLLLLVTRLSIALSPLLLTGPAGGEDPKFSKQMNDKFLRDRGTGPVETWWSHKMPSWLGGGGDTAIADSSMSDPQKTFLKALSEPESNGDYTLKNGGSHFTDFSKFPEGVGAGGTSTASGRYQFTSDTWREVARAHGLTDFSPTSQDRGAWYLAEDEYRKSTGRDLQMDLTAGGHDDAIARALKGRWPSLPGGSQYNPKSSHPPLSIPSGGLPGQMKKHPFYNPLAQPDPALNLRPGSGNFANTQLSSPTSYTIGTVIIQTQATDAPGIAKDFSRSLVTQANRGPQ